MNCSHFKPLLDAYLDNELDAGTSGDITRHLAGCAACRGLHAGRDALRAEVRAQAPYFEAPVALQRHVERFGGAPVHERVVQRKSVNRFAAGALAGVAALAGLLAGLWFARPAPEDPLASLREQIVASHAASLAVNGRLTDVSSSDQHVVKPWLQGKIDFAPVVRDYTTDGFRLVGARLDQVGERQTAAVVYRIRNHVINVFAWRAQRHEPAAVSLAVARGYGVATWAEGGLRYAAISDVDMRDLSRLAALMARSAHAPQTPSAP
jgi:anti-sigma factor RsiW